MDNEKHKMTFARALFDNVAEMPRELSFKKGDILTVLQERYENNPEWWVCSLRNMVGLAPANRLEAMPILTNFKPTIQSQMSGSMYDELPEQLAPVDSCYFNIPKTGKEDTYSTYQLPMEDVYVNPVTRVLRPSKGIDDQSLYQIPTDESYSTVATVTPCNSNTNTLDDNKLRPISSKESITNEYYNNRYDYSDSFSDATSSSFTESSAHSFNHFSLTSSDSGDFRSLQMDHTAPLLLSPDEAILKYRQLQTNTTASCNRVLEFVKSKWKTEELLKSTINSLRQSFLDFGDNLNILITFASGVYQNSLNCADLNLTKKLGKHVSPLQESKQSVKDALEKLELMNWDAEKIATSVRLSVRDGADALGQIVTAARNVLINTRSLSVTISGNATILFAGVSIQHGDDSNDDGVSMRTTVTRDSCSSYDESSIQNVWRLFGQQVQSQVELVNETVDDFIASLTTNKYQEAHFQDTVSSNSKFVVRSATQLVCIAKNLSDTKIKSMPCDKIEDAGNKLCDSLKTMINVTKQLIGGDQRRSSQEQRNQLLNQLRAVKGNANNVHRIVLIACKV